MSLGITVRHHSASHVMPLSDPRDLYPLHTPMKDTYFTLSLALALALATALVLVEGISKMSYSRTSMA